uniref:RNA helicase n=1 Tax=Phlebotomus papatasi TaxID=29031 RepID=A0A1B0D7F3_PHLPP
MERIIITHFVDPHRFWFRLDEPFQDQGELLDFRANLNKAIQRADKNEGWTPAVGEVVAYFYKHSAMLERAVVNSIGLNGELTLWLVDIGHPQRARRDEVRPIPKNVKLPEKKTIREGGIFQLVPAKRKFNLQTLKVEMVDCGNVWSQDAIELMKEAIEFAESLRFEARSFPDDNFVFGNLTFVMPNGRKLSAVDLLGDYSRRSEDFLEMISRNLCPKLRLKNSGNDLEAVPASQDYVNKWIEKVVDVQNDNFDESVSTFHTPAVPATIPKCPEMDEWDHMDHHRSRPAHKVSEILEEDEFSSVPSSHQMNGRPGKVSVSPLKSSSSASDGKSLVEARRAHSMKLLEESLSEKDLVVPSGRSQLVPQPAGMVNSKDVPIINRPKRKNSKSPLEVEKGDPREKIRALGDVAIAPSAKKRYQRLLAHGENSCLTWPHIFRGGSVVVIGHKRSGKTLAYLPMLFTRMMNDKEKEQAEMQIGARAIVICSSSKNVYKTSKTFDGYNDKQKMKLSVLPSCNPRDTRNHVIELQNGVDILFTTAPGFKRLWQCAQKETVDLLTLDEVRYLIVDDYDEIVQHFRSELKFAMDTIMSRVDENDLCRAEVVITSRKWMPKFKEFWKKFDNPMLCIASGVEAALYGGGKFTLDIMDTEQKVVAIREILATEEYFIEPTMIVCNTAEEVNYLASDLRKNSVSVMTFTEPSREELMVKDQCVIICTDASLMDINMRRIQNLIHFSLPEKWSTFDRRFVVCFDYYEDQVVCEDVTKSPVKVHIFLDQHNDKQLPKMIYFMKTRFSSVDISNEILECARATVIRREEGKVNRGEPLCSAMMEFGECKVDQIDCPYRHRFSIDDAPSELLPKKGVVRMKILAVMTPLHFMCNILHSMESYIDPYEKWIVVNQSNRFSVFQNDLNRHMMTKENQLTPASADVQEHDIYLLPFDYSFLRVRVLSVLTEKGQTFVSITGVDIHKVVDRFPAQELLVLPEEFRDFPHQLINVRLFGLVPNDHEMMWDSRSTNTVKDLVKSVEESDKKFFIGEVELTLKNTIYVKSLLCVEFIDSTQTNFAQFSLKGQILKDQIAVEGDKDKIQVIRKLAQVA